MNKETKHQEQNFSNLLFSLILSASIFQILVFSEIAFAQGLVVDDDQWDPKLGRMGAVRRSDYNRYHDSQTLKANANLAWARFNKIQQPAAFINCLLEQANTFQMILEKSKADELYNEALRFYTTELPANNLSRAVRLRDLWTFVSNLPEQEAEAKSESLLRATELHVPSASLSLFLEAVHDRRGSENDKAVYQVNMLLCAVNIVSSTRGANDPSLIGLRRELQYCRKQLPSARPAGR